MIATPVITTCAPKAGAPNASRAAFPGGSITGAKLIERGLVMAYALFDELCRLVQQASQDFFDELIFAREMVRNDAFADPGLPGNLRKRGLGKPLSGDRLDGRFDDLAAARPFDEAGLFLSNRLKI